MIYYNPNINSVQSQLLSICPDSLIYYVHLLALIMFGIHKFCMFETMGTRTHAHINYVRQLQVK